MRSLWNRWNRQYDYRMEMYKVLEFEHQLMAGMLFSRIFVLKWLKVQLFLILVLQREFFWVFEAILYLCIIWIEKDMSSIARNAVTQKYKTIFKINIYLNGHDIFDMFLLNIACILFCIYCTSQVVISGRQFSRKLVELP